jgi:predicted DCC family thiol-disulfide oxidoreductase YuxK
MTSPIEALFVLYDDSCGFCCLCANWLRAQPQQVPLTCLPRSAARTREIFGALTEGNDELVVVDSSGGVYRGPDAFVMSLWALQDYRSWSRRAAREPLRSRSRALLYWLSTRRHAVSQKLGLAPEAEVMKALDYSSTESASFTCAR